MKLSRSEPYVYWEDIPRRPNRCGEAWERYHQRMREKSQDQRERVVSALLAYNILQMHLNIWILMVVLLAFLPIHLQMHLNIHVLLLFSCFLEMNLRKNINLY